MRRLVLPILLIVASIAAFQYSDRRGEQADTARSAVEVSAPTTPLLSARRLPALLDEPRARQELSAGLEGIVARSPQLSCLVVHDLAGTELHAAGPDVGLAPASLQKLATASAALQLFGPEAQFRTVVASTAAVVDGVLDGDLYLIGGGDPLLHTDDYVATFDTDFPHTRLEDLAEAVLALGITQINGGVIADETRYDLERQPADWDPDGATAAGGGTGPLSALMVNDGFVAFPEVREPGVFATPASDPAIEAAALFDDLLEERGVVIAGGSRNEPEPPAELVELASVQSPSMDQLVGEMLRFSDNTTAELVLKEIGFVHAGEGTTDAGALAVLELLGSRGVDVSAMLVVDGSGLSTRNRLSCQSVIDILGQAGLESPIGAGLPVSGGPGTLRDRFATAPLRDVVHAKTGTLATVTGLAGFIETIPGEVLSFSYIMNVEPEVTDAQLALQEELLRHLVDHPTGPPLSALEPLGADRDPAAPYRPGASGEATDPEPAPEAEPSEPADEDGTEAPTGGEAEPAPADEGGGLGPDE